MPGPSPAIANEFIKLAIASGRALTPMQLQKLVYIANGWNLAIAGSRLTSDAPRAWDYGPVYPDLYKALRRYGSSPVPEEIKLGDYGVGQLFGGAGVEQPARASLSEQESAIINRVFTDYGGFHAFQLSALTHEAQTPWSRVYDSGQGRFDEIDEHLIRDHFIDLARRRNGNTTTQATNA